MEYEITVKRICVEAFNVTANSREEAEELAETEAQNHDWSRSQAEYEVE